MSSARGDIPRFRLGLRARMTLWSTAVLAASLGLGFAWVHVGLGSILRARNDEFLTSKAREFSSLLDEQADPDGGPDLLAAEARREVASHGADGLVVVVHGGGATRVFPVGHEAGRLLGGIGDLGHAGPVTVRSPESGACYRVARVWARPGGSGTEVVVALALAPTEAILKQFDRSVAAGWLAFLGLAVVGGLWLSRQALRPVARSIASARQLNPADLSARLPRSGVGDEIDLLAGTVNDLLDRLGSYHAQMTRFTADASHELRGPLAALRAAIEVALGQDRPAEAYRETLVTLGERCDRLSSLVDGLLLLARADAGEVEIRREPVDLAAVVAEIAEMFEPLAEERGIALGLDASGPVPVVGDPTRLAQLATNLLDNAIKFTEAGGAVAVRVGRAGERAFLEVSDGGVGIRPDRLPHVFERFSQGDPARSSKGAGLGLNICRWIVEAHGGTIRAESEVGRGSRFVVDLPTPTDAQRAV